MSDCIEWTGSVAGQGKYAQSPRREFGTRYMHRILMARKFGPDAIKGKVVMHLCDNPLCVNVDHLRIGTNTDNLQDMARKGRHKTKLCPRKVTFIRDMTKQGFSRAFLGELLDMTPENVGHVVLGKTWRHVS